MRPSLGIIILNWNRLNDTRRCLKTLLESDLKATRIYVVDNGSCDQQAETIAEEFPEVSVLAQSENTGFCRGNNIGIQRALADGANLVALLNNDTIVPANTFQALGRDFADLADAGAISPVIIPYPDTESSPFIRAAWNSEKAQFDLNPDKLSFADVHALPPWRSEFANGCCLLTSADVIEKVGLLDERYFAYYDEADWCSRMSAHGLSAYVTSSCSIYHVDKGVNPKSSRIAMYLLTRNRLLWMRERLSTRRRLVSAGYLAKEVLWHMSNLIGLTNKLNARDISKAYLLGFRDYALRRFGKWKDGDKSFFEA